MAEDVFLDAVGLIALLNEDDQYHELAEAVSTKIVQSGRKVVTTNLVLAEVANGLARTVLREEVVSLINKLGDDSNTTVVYADADSFADGLALYADRKDKLWGLVDCVSFVVMGNARIRDAFTADHHFAQAGFNCLLPQVRRDRAD